MDAKQYLVSLGEFDERIGRKIRRLGELDAARMFSEEKLKSVRCVCGESGDGSAEDEFNALRTEIAEDVAEFRRRRSKAVETIKRLNNVRYVRVLYEHYVEYKSIKEISEEMFISCSHTHLLHKKALDALGGLL